MLSSDEILFKSFADTLLTKLVVSSGFTELISILLLLREVEGFLILEPHLEG